MANSKTGNKTVQEYFDDLKNIRLSDNTPVTSVDNVFIIVLTLIGLQSCYCMFKICFTPSHSIKPLFPTYKPREWTKRYRSEYRQNTSHEMAPLRHEKEVENNINLQKTSLSETPVTEANFHNVKF